MNRISMAAVVTVFLFLIAGLADSADARARSGGRSFGQSRSYSKPTQPPQSAPNQAVRPGGMFGSTGSFTRGLAGGLMGGFLGSMLFGGLAHGMGMGGFGGSGIGLIEILLLGGLGYFLFRKFSRRAAPAAQGATDSVYNRGATGGFEGFGGRQAVPDAPADDPLSAGLREIRMVDRGFDPEGFKETAQDLFFKIQAGWTRREVSALKAFVGDRLLDEYARHFTEMQGKGHINRLENIAVRKVDLAQAGVEAGEIFVTVRFIANLLDYTVDEDSGSLVEGDMKNPVKFQESWTFARPIEGGSWKLEGIEA
jgi:predicted lipid-binding transport protein (Tim44 family)